MQSTKNPITIHPSCAAMHDDFIFAVKARVILRLAINHSIKLAYPHRLATIAHALQLFVLLVCCFVQHSAASKAYNHLFHQGWLLHPFGSLRCKQMCLQVVKQACERDPEVCFQPLQQVGVGHFQTGTAADPPCPRGMWSQVCLRWERPGASVVECPCSAR